MKRWAKPGRRSLPPILWRAIDDADGEEVCGLLVEYGDQLGFRRIENLAGPGEFSVDPWELERASLDIARQGGAIKMLVHSHFRSPTPSAADHALAARTPWPLLIVTMTGDLITVEPARCAGRPQPEQEPRDL